MHRWNSVLQACGNLRAWDQSNEHLYGKTSNRRTCTFHGYTRRRNKRRGVAIAYDSRHQSPEFAMEAAKTLAHHNIPSYVFESLRPTPELSFAVRHLKTFAGIMVTASHNPAATTDIKSTAKMGDKCLLQTQMH